jgi:hypothetical protein
MGLAGSAWPKSDDILAPQGPFAASEFQHLRSTALSDGSRSRSHCSAWGSP